MAVGVSVGLGAAGATTVGVAVACPCPDDDGALVGLGIGVLVGTGVLTAVGGTDVAVAAATASGVSVAVGVCVGVSVALPVSTTGAVRPCGKTRGVLTGDAVGLGVSRNTRSVSGSVAKTQPDAASATPLARPQIVTLNRRDAFINLPINPIDRARPSESPHSIPLGVEINAVRGQPEPPATISYCEMGLLSHILGIHEYSCNKFLPNAQWKNGDTL